MAQRPTLILGVDFGVSTSSVSYRLLRHGHSADHIAPPALIRPRGDLTGSVPSELGSGPSDTWGHGITPQHTRLKFLKLALVDPAELSPDLQPLGWPGLVQEALDKIGTEGYMYFDTDVVAEYLKRLWADCSPRVVDFLRYSDLEADDVDVQFMFGVPAAWEEETVDSMREAIEESGMLSFGRTPATLSFIHDTEAVASTVIPAVVSQDYLHSIKVGDTILILDAGGGTVDIAAYTLRSLTPVAIHECIPSEGQFIGAIFMMNAFMSFARQQVQHHMGPDHGAVDQAALEAGIQEAWETIQNVTATALTRGTWSYWLDIQRLDHVPTPAARLAGHEIARALRAITYQVVKFTLKQAYAVEVATGKRPKRIIVVGGFGCNDLLQSDLREQFGDRMVFTDMSGQYSVKNSAVLADIARV